MAKFAKIAEIAMTAEIAETQIVKFFKTFKIRVFFEKTDRFLEKNFNFIENR